jgi:hypothetical protein
MADLAKSTIQTFKLSRRTVQWAIFAVGTVIILGLWLGPFARNVRWVNGDQLTYQRILEHMRAGEDYYQATVSQLQDHSYIRYFRMPVMFWFWAGTGSFSWASTLLVLVVTGGLVGVLSWPLAGLGIELWLVGLSHPFGTEQWGYNEVWALPFVLLAVLGVRRERWWLAALSVLAAALIRETAVLFLVGGAVGAYVLSRPLPPWIAACLAWVVFMVWHVSRVLPLLAPSAGGPAPAGSLWHALDMFGAWLIPLSALIVVYALWRARFTFEWFLAVPALVLIPLAGFWMYRPYWSYLVLPIAVSLCGSQQVKQRIDS